MNWTLKKEKNTIKIRKKIKIRKIRRKIKKERKLMTTEVKPAS